MARGNMVRLINIKGDPSSCFSFFLPSLVPWILWISSHIMGGFANLPLEILVQIARLATDHLPSTDLIQLPPFARIYRLACHVYLTMLPSLPLPNIVKVLDHGFSYRLGQVLDFPDLECLLYWFTHGLGSCHTLFPLQDILAISVALLDCRLYRHTGHVFAYEAMELLVSPTRRLASGASQSSASLASSWTLFAGWCYRRCEIVSGSRSNAASHSPGFLWGSRTPQVVRTAILGGLRGRLGSRLS
ncbi:hypothetical protein BJ875DRAFT_476998 [Amylocarpus encephaloides]|uniref:Uncharacterized protein n=1 Tax=Amylocarpus encephaloides TaxID=45428 RepID=A0A9P8C065_9HELO|nr:hypothetical protein BJ875DRAFT_476998 [Amylocarpus encephaloides]